MRISGTGQTFFNTLELSRSGAGETTIPTATRLLAEGGTSLTGRQRAVTSQFRFLKRNVPTVDLTLVSPLNALKAQNTDAVLSRLRRPHPVGIKSELGSRFLMEQKSRFNRIFDILVRLRLRTGDLQQKSSFNIKSAATSDPDLVEAVAQQDGLSGEYDIVITRIAQSHELGSPVASDPGAALGLSGTFRINGWNVDVGPSDSLISIRDKINQGEDINKNGILDPAEDINGNGTIDVLRAPAVYTPEGYLPSFYYNEDINGNGVLDGAEDTNDNDMADGGFSQIGVRAVVAGGQLVLISDEPADVELRFRDPNRILERIGFLFRHNAGGEVTTEKLNPQSIQPQKAVFKVNGDEFTSTQNRVTDALTGITLTLKAAGSASVRVEDDANIGLIQVIRFTISYNDALRLINSAIESGGALSKNLRLQSIHSDTVRSFYTPPPEPKGQFKSVADIGIFSDSGEPTAINQLAFEQLPKLQQDGLSLPGPGKFSLFGQSDRVGVNSSENFIINVDTGKVAGSLEKDSMAVGDLLGFAAGRLQKRLDVHLQPNYGTIQFQKNVIDFYLGNRNVVQTVMLRTLTAAKTDIESGSSKNIFSSFA